MSDMQLAHEGYELKFADLQFGASFAAQWAPRGDGLGGPPVEDAGTLHFTISHDYEELYEDGITVAVTLGQIVADIAEGCQERDGLIRDDEFATSAVNIVDAMRAAADLLEAKIENPSKVRSARDAKKRNATADLVSGVIDAVLANDSIWKKVSAKTTSPIEKNAEIQDLTRNKSGANPHET